MIFRFIFAAIAVEAVTEILIHSTLLDKPRTFLRRHGFYDLFECGWCMSVWVGLFVFGLYLFNIELILIPLVFHRLSNFVHIFYIYLRSLSNAIRNQENKRQ